MKNKFWDNVPFPLTEETLITKDVINKSINDFWKQIVKKIKPTDKGSHLLLLFRVRTGDHFLTLGYLQKLNLEDKEYFQRYIFNLFDMKEDSYKQMYINEIIISYGVRDGLITKSEIKPTTNFLNYKHFKLPITMNPLEYGYCVFQSEKLYVIRINSDTLASLEINIEGESQINEVTIHRKETLAFRYKDIYINDNKFERHISNRTYIYSREDIKQDFTLELLTISKPARFISVNKKDMTQNHKIITLDIETYEKNDDDGGTTLVPYLISWYDGVKYNSYYLSDYNSSSEMITKALTDLKRKKYHNHKIYIHNLAGFDGLFITKELANVGFLTPIIHEGKIISLKLTFSNENETKSFTLLYLDSLQLLLTSLRKLCKAFNLEIIKGIFPHKFVNVDNLDYIGVLPSYEYFINKDVTENEYEDFKKSLGMVYNEWNLRKEAIKYCELDCLTLFNIMSGFNDLMYNNLQIDMTKYPTVSSLAMALFRMHYLNEEIKIPMISGQVYKDIKQSYTGGATDMFIPTNDCQAGELVYAYDVNSLYPYVMANCELPSGKPTYFEGDIRKINNEAFGFFFCKVSAPKDLVHPIIQLHLKTKTGVRTIAPTGTFEGMFFSEEVNNAKKYGYTFEILWGYTFDKQIIFKDYVDSLYKMRLTYDKSNPMNYICKILMNSLYGKFGMDDLFDTCDVVHNDNLENVLSDNVVYDIIEIGDNYIVKTERNKTSTYLDNATETHNVNIAIASAITSYARIYMSQFKNNSELKLFYTDTDSIYTNLSPDIMNELYPGMISSKGLGLLKHEGTFKRAIFLAPKCYFMEDLDGKLTYKVKGLKKDVIGSAYKFDDFESLLSREKVMISLQEKWFRSISDGNIRIKPMEYSLRVTDNKRELVYEANKLVNTNPYNVVSGIIKK